MLTTYPDQLQTPITEARKMISEKREYSQIFEDAKKTAKRMLGIISKNTMPKREHSEKSRKTVIDIVIYSALEVVNQIFSESQPRGIFVEEGLFNDKDGAIPVLPAEIIGSDPLDYYVPGGVIISTQSIDEGEETIVEDVNMEDESSGNNVSSFTDIEAKTDLNDNALYQLLGQLHDALYVKVEAQGQKRKLEADIENAGTIRVKLNREKVIGILSAGHRAEVFSIRVDPDTLRKIVVFHGRRTLKVLRYLEPTLVTSSFRVKDWTVEVCIDDSELDEMLLLFIAVFSKLV